jgi:hypothetical protein
MLLFYAGDSIGRSIDVWTNYHFMNTYLASWLFVAKVALTTVFALAVGMVARQSRHRPEVRGSEFLSRTLLCTVVDKNGDRLLHARQRR